MSNKIKHCLNLLFFFTGHLFYGQTFLNGDFELNIASGCDYNNTNAQFNSKISNVYAFGNTLGSNNNNTGEVDLQTFGCSVSPQNGSWCLGISCDYSPTTDAVAIELSSVLIPGQSYQVSFYVFGNPLYGNPIIDIKIGMSAASSSFGTLLFTSTPDSNAWKHLVFNFTPSQSVKFITVTNQTGAHGWNQIDNFTINTTTGNTTGIQENYSENHHFSPNPFSSTAVLQAPTAFNDATLIIYNSAGQEVRQLRNISEKTITLERDHLPAGLYFIRLVQAAKIIAVEKLILVD